jgi:hypothetical protein
LSNNLFSRRRRYGQYLTMAQHQKIITDYIRARDAFHQAVEQVHRDRDTLVKAGLIADDDEIPDQ